MQPPSNFGKDPQPVTDLVDGTGTVILDYHGIPIRDFDFLPRHISIRPPGWLLEFWMRTDLRLTYQDLRARMVREPSQRPQDFMLDMMREEDARWPLGLSHWQEMTNEHISRIEVKRVERWTPDQIRLNTTMSVKYTDSTSNPRAEKLMSKRLDNLSEDGEEYDLDSFKYRDHTPSAKLVSTIEFFFDLTNRARQQHCRSWCDLPDNQIPRSWWPAPDDHRPYVLQGYRNSQPVSYARAAHNVMMQFLVMSTDESDSV